MRRHRSRVSNLSAGVIAAVLVLGVCYLVFGGPIPFTGSSFQLRATFTAETQLHLASPVRIAGVEVGTVTSVKRVGGSSTAAVVTMAIQSNGLPIYANATADIRPRLFLEGNFYVDLHPGTPSAHALSSGGTLPAANTSGPVQLDRVLSALNSNTRSDLQALVRGFGGALNGAPTPAEDATQDPTQRGLTAGQSLNQSLKYSAGAFRASAIVNQALLGEKPHDLSQVVAGTQRLFGALSSDQGRLSDLVDALNTTMAALSHQQNDLQQTIALLPGTLRATNAALGPVQASFAPTREFARELTPSIRELGPTIDAGLPWLRQSIALFSPSELGGLVASLTPAIQGTSQTLTSTQVAAARLRRPGPLLRQGHHPDRQREDLRPPGDDRPAGLPGALPVGRRVWPPPPRTSTATAATCGPPRAAGTISSPPARCPAAARSTAAPCCPPWGPGRRSRARPRRSAPTWPAIATPPRR